MIAYCLLLPIETTGYYFPKRHLYTGDCKLKNIIKNVKRDIHYYVSQSRVLWISFLKRKKISS